MTEKPTPIDPARVLAALEVLGWPDDRGEQYAEDAAVMPAEAHYRLAEEVIRATDAATATASHILEVTHDGSWSLEHPAACRSLDASTYSEPDKALWDCDVRRVAEQQLPAAGLPLGRYECSVNDLGDVFLLGDRVDQTEG